MKWGEVSYVYYFSKTLSLALSTHFCCWLWWPAVCVLLGHQSQHIPMGFIVSLLSNPSSLNWLTVSLMVPLFFQTFRFKALELTLSSFSGLSFESPSPIFSVQSIAGICSLLSSWLDLEVPDFWIKIQMAVSLHLCASVIIYMKHSSNCASHWFRKPQNLLVTYLSSFLTTAHWELLGSSPIESS